MADFVLDFVAPLTDAEIKHVSGAFDAYSAQSPTHLVHALPAGAVIETDAKAEDKELLSHKPPTEPTASTSVIAEATTDTYGGDRPGFFKRFSVLLRRSRQVRYRHCFCTLHSSFPIVCLIVRKMFVRNVANAVVRITAAAVVGVLLALPSTHLALDDYGTRIRVIYGLLQTATLLPFAGQFPPLSFSFVLNTGLHLC